MRCSKCKAENPGGKKFCGKCGARLGGQCPKCGAENPPDDTFCGDCGEALGTAASPKESDTSPVRVTEAAEAEKLEGERKTVTALFADIKGSTELEQDLDPEEARAIVDPALKLMIDAVHRYDGYIVQSTGDGIFALFGAPVAHEDHPQRALYAALRMQEELKRYSTRLREAGSLPLEARVGVNTGEVVVRSIATGQGHTEYTPIGHTANLASRMQALAPTGSIAITGQTGKLVEGYFALKALGPTRVKGVSEPVSVYEVTGLGPLRTRLQRSAGRGLTKFVGREREMEALGHAAELSQAGHGQIAAAMAEAGTGKSRLFFEFKATSAAGWMVLEAFSVSHGKASAYLPVIDLLHSYFKILAEDDARTRREKVTGRLLALASALEDTLLYLLGLLGIVEGEQPLAGMDPQVRKRRTLDAIKRVLLRESLNQPLMVIFEDLHWIDDETQAFLNLLSDSIGTARILLLVNYRPQYSHQWGSKTSYTQLRLDPLGKESADEMLSALLGDTAEIVPLKRLIIEKTEGNPFFMEETVQVLFDEGALVRDGAVVKRTKSLSALRIPPTVQGILAARIDRLPADEKDLLQTLAVIGREFRLSIVREVMKKPDDDLSRMLDDLQLSEFIYEQPTMGDVEYTFKHALTQEVAYNSVLVQRRKQLHERAARALETLHASSLDDHLAELAHHYARSANTEKALVYLRAASRQAVRRGAYEESVRYLSQALETLRTMPQDAKRDRQELRLHGFLLPMVAIGRSYAATELEPLLARSRELCERLDDKAGLRQVLFVLHDFHFVSGHLSVARELTPRLLAIAEELGEPGMLADAHYAAGEDAMLGGEYLSALGHFDQRADLAPLTGSPVRDQTWFYARHFSSFCLMILGRLQEGQDRSNAALAQAEKTSEPLLLAIGHRSAATMGLFCGQYEKALEHAEIVSAIAEEHGLSQYTVRAQLVRVSGLIGQGHYQEAVDLSRPAFVAAKKLGVLKTEDQAEIYWAEGKIGKPAEGLKGIDTLLASQRETESEAGWGTAHRFRGELLLMLDSLRSEEAEDELRAAVGVARRQQAKWHELKATLSLARLLTARGKRDEARAMLAEIYNWFTEGFDTADLKDAKALLDELSV